MLNSANPLGLQLYCHLRAAERNQHRVAGVLL